MTSEYKEFLVDKLDSLIERIKEPYLQELCFRLVGNEGRFRKEFITFPAAKGFHHAYPGGLLEHSLEVADFCIIDCELIVEKYKYNSLNLDLLICASLLHDLGKIHEYEISDIVDGRIYYQFSETGKLIGHLCLSAMMAYSEIDNIHNFPSKLKDELCHIILSHHGRIEWGNAVKPITKEADFFHMADHRSATIAKS